MTTFKSLLTGASVAALLASPLAAQSTSDGNPVADTTSSMEEKVSTESNLEAQVEKPLDMAGETTAEATAPGANMDSTELEFGFSTSVAMAIAGAKLDADSTLVGYNVVTREGSPVGDVAEVYTTASDKSYLVVNLDERLNISADKFIVRLDATKMDGSTLALSTNEVEFTNGLKKSAGDENVKAN